MDARRITRITIAGLLIAAALAAATASLLQGDRYRERLESLAAEYLDATLHINGRLVLALLPRPSVAAQDIVLEHDGAEIGRAEQARIEFSWLSLLRRQPAVKAIRLQAPHLALTRAADGSLNLRLRNDGASDHDTEPQTGRDLTLGQLKIEAGHFSLTQHTAGGGHSIILEEFTLALEDVRLDSESAPFVARLALQGDLSAERLHLNAVTIEAAQARLSAANGQLALADVRGVLFDGQLSGTLDMEQTESQLQLNTNVSLSAFSLQAFLRQIIPELNAQGQLDFTAELASQSRNPGDWLQQLDGQLMLRGEQLLLQGMDMDAELARYQDTQRFNLVDLGALVFAGPAGIAATKSAGFAQLMKRSDGETRIRELLSRWDIQQGTAQATDVALATAHNRLVLLGQLDLNERRFSDTEVAVVDRNGCAVIRQGISGTFAQPQVEPVNYIRALLGAPLDLLRQGLSLIDLDRPCEPVYHGSIASP